MRYAFGSLLGSPLRNGISAPSRLRGTGVHLINMKEIFAHDRIGLPESSERAPLPTSGNAADHLLQTGDLLFARQSLTLEGAGKCSLVLDHPQERSWESHLIRARLNRSVASPGFYFYYFKSPAGRFAISGIVQQVAAAGIRGSDLSKLPVPVPPLSQQQAIAEVLGALDDKIAANTRMSQTSDALVRILYASLPSSTSVLGDFSDNVRDQVQPNGCIPYVGLEHVGRRHLWLHEQGTSDEVTSAKSVFQAGDVLFGKLRPYFHKVVSAPVDGICSTDILVLRAKDPALAGYVLAAAGSTEVVDHSTARSAGTKMPRASWADLSEAPIRWAGRDAAHRLSKIVTAVREATEAAIRESQTLAQLRDTLLPALMDGRLRVHDAVEQIEGKF